MISRIRVGVLIFKDDKILLVKHVHPKTGFTWWVPPGGGLDGQETIFECGAREVQEETGLSVEFDKIAYIRQFIYREEDQNNMDVYITASSMDGIETIDNIHGKGPDDQYIKELRYFSREEIQDITVFPEILQGQMWDDLKSAFPHPVFIGVEYDVNE